MSHEFLNYHTIKTKPSLYQIHRVGHGDGRHYYLYFELKHFGKENYETIEIQ